MSNRRHLHAWFERTPGKPIALLGLALGVAIGCSNEGMPGHGNTGPDDANANVDGGHVDGSPTSPEGGNGDAGPANPFRSMEPAANAPGLFSEPRSGVPLADGSVAFLATVEGSSDLETTRSGTRVAVWLQAPGEAQPRVLYAGDKLVNPFDIDASIDGKTLYIADIAGGAEGDGAIVTMSPSGGEPTELVSGYAPRAITVSDKGDVFFSGLDEATGEAGVFTLSGTAVSRVFAGAPLVDPSGIAVLKDGGVLVVDTRLFDGAAGAAQPYASEAGVVLIKDGQASIFATGFATGYPAGIALTIDDKALIISGEGRDRSDTVYIVDVGNPKAPKTVVTDKFSAYQDSSAGLKRAHDSNRFIWASLAANGGTVYSIQAK
jgi:hypothetical protein